MRKNIKEILTTLALVICVISCSFLFLTACGKDASGTYTVEVVTEGGMALEKVGVYVYADESMEDVQAVAKTDKEGKATFESEGAIGSVIVLKDIPIGYKEQTYEIKEKDTKIVLEAELLSADNLEGVKLGLGDVFADMTVEATDGKTYVISELLEEKKAVVLNFWYLNCNPCRMEFPYLKEAYAEYKDEIEVIAVNPYDGTTETVADYQKELALDFPMAAIDYEWQEVMNITAYPMTVVIDRYGTIAFIHKAAITETETFTTIFEYFTADDYKQTTIRNVEDILK